MVLGFRERVVSSDHNRLQAFMAAEIADAFRYLFDADAREDQAAALATLGIAAASPMRAVVINGSLVRPEIGTFNLFVSAGMALCVSPEATANPDDSPAQLVRDPGQAVAGALVISTPGGGTRIDVIEVSVSQLVVESDNRDIFNPSTGTFTPALLNKVVEARFTYRVRAGTPGGGFPGTATGWLPLAVASVPSAAASNNDVTFWDVRPLLSDMANGTHIVRETWAGARRQQGSAIDETGAGAWRARGIFELELSGRRVGGELAPTGSGTTYLDLTSASVQEPGFAAVASTPWYVYLAFPFGLPRWAKYSPSSVGYRVPVVPRGIPIFTQSKVPAGLSGKAGSAISLPTDTGLGSSTTEAIVAMAGVFGAGPAWCNSVMSDGWTVHNVPAILLAAVSGNNSSAPVFNLVGNTSYPAHASALRLKFTSTLTIASTTVLSVVRTVIVTDNTGSTTVFTWRRSSTEVGPVAGSFLDEFELDVPLVPNLPGGAAQTLKVGLTYSVGGGAPTYSSQGVYVMGWRLGG